MKMEIIAALLHKPKFILLDEPTIGLDVISQSKIREFIKFYNEEHNATFLLTSHYMNDIQASICLEQLKKLPEYLQKRRKIQRRYNNELSEYIMIPEWSETVQFYSARVNKKCRDSLISYLASKKIHSTVHFKPLHLHPILSQNRNFPVADSEWKKLVSFPCHPGMNDDDIDYVIYWIKEYFNG